MPLIDEMARAAVESPARQRDVKVGWRLGVQQALKMLADGQSYGEIHRALLSNEETQSLPGKPERAWNKRTPRKTSKE